MIARTSLVIVPFWLCKSPINNTAAVSLLMVRRDTQRGIDVNLFTDVVSLIIGTNVLLLM